MAMLISPSGLVLLCVLASIQGLSTDRVPQTPRHQQHSVLGDNKQDDTDNKGALGWDWGIFDDFNNDDKSGDALGWDRQIVGDDKHLSDKKVSEKDAIEWYNEVLDRRNSDLFSSHIKVRKMDGGDGKNIFGGPNVAPVWGAGNHLVRLDGHVVGGSWQFYFPSAEELLARKSGRPFTIIVEGNVGSGKSTLLEFFRAYPDIAIHPEPVDVWENLNGTDLLGLVFQDPERWGMTFQSLVQLTMMETHLMDARKDGEISPAVKVMERSIHSGKHVFIERLRHIIQPAEMALLEAWYDLLLRRPEFDLDVDLIVYLRTSPEVALQRVGARGRKEELPVVLEFIQEIHRYYEQWLNKLMTARVPGSLPHIIIVDADTDISVLSETYRSLAKAVWNSIPKALRTGHFFST